MTSRTFGPQLGGDRPNRVSLTRARLPEEVADLDLRQFDPAGENGVISGLGEVLKVLDALPFAQARWLQLPNVCQSAAATGFSRIRQTAATTKGSESEAAERWPSRRGESLTVCGQQHWPVRHHG